MSEIHILPIEISNKIAAGEVVERPSSVIKELVENSIDAGATRVTVEIRNGGATYMCVSDNGKGMSPDDALRAFYRHATSKIQTEDDLDAIYTLGFRGEALSSIGAVSKAALYTKQKNSQNGICVTCEGGEIIASEENGMPEGTKLVVKDLFYNTPARMKFLKKDATEAGYVTDVMTRFVLSHPEISFRFVKNGKDVIFSQGDGNLKNAVYAVYGRDYANAVLAVDYTQGAVKVGGVVGKGNLARPNRSFQSFFINGRYIKSPLITRAVEEAYKNQIMIGKYPICALNLEINPAYIDINVHPTKLEVKFSNEKEVYEAVYYGVKNTLYAIPNVPEIEKKESKKTFSVQNMYSSGEQLAIEHKNDKNSSIAAEKKENSHEVPDKKILSDNAYIKESPIAQFIKKDEQRDFKLSEPESELKIGEKPADTTVIGEPEGEIKTDINSEDNSKSVETNKDASAYDGKIKTDFNLSDNTESVETNKDASAHDSKIKTDFNSADNIAENEPKKQISAGQAPVAKSELYRDIKAIGQLFDTYIIAECGDSVIFIDQHAAHERIKYEQLLKSIENHELYPQMLLEGITVKLSGAEEAAFEANSDFLSGLGFVAECYGENTVIIRATPPDVEMGDAEDLFLELLGELINSKKEIIGAKMQRLTYTIACKAAVKANHSLTRSETESLIRGVMDMENINTCPHGRPIMIKMTKKELEKQFKRIV